jgi:hypothetical protein
VRIKYYFGSTAPVGARAGVSRAKPVTFTMASTTSGLPPLDPLFKSNAKRTYSAFASYPDAGLREEEKRCV